jgi:hypothetical protein
MMDEMQEEKDIHDQISDATSRPIGDPFDDVSSDICIYTFICIRTILLLGSFINIGKHHHHHQTFAYCCFVP